MAKKNRCAAKECKKKLNPSQRICGKCRCGMAFCPAHFMNHACDYVEEDEKEKAPLANAKFEKLEKL